jgi:hypothetical protein
LSDWFKELFIDEAKAAIDSRSSGGDSAEQYEAGYEAGHEVGVAAGQKSEYDRFWDSYQNYGRRGSYRYAFAGAGWTNETFKPKYDIVVSSGAPSQGMFFSVGIDGNLTQILKDLGVRLDLSKSVRVADLFCGSTKITNIPELSIANATAMANLLQGCTGLVSVEKIILNSEGTQTIGSTTFESCGSLTNIVFEGCIGSDINFQWSPLTTDSMKSVITHLKNYSGTSKENTYRVVFTDTCWAALEVDGTTAPDGSTWRDYVEYTLCWLT